MDNEIIFIVKDSQEGGFDAQALGESIFTEGDTMEELKENVRDAVKCHYEEEGPKMIRLHYVKDEVFAA